MSDESSVSGKLWEAGNIKDQPACRNRLSVIILSALKNGTYLLTNLSENFSMTLILLVSLFIFFNFTSYSTCTIAFYKMISKAYNICILCTQRLMIHQIFLLAHNWPKCMWQKLSFPPASLSENCSCFGTDNVHGKISVHIFAPNRGYCLHIPAKRYPNVIATPTLTNTPSFL